MQHSPRFLQLIENTKTRTHEIAISDVKQRLEHNKTFYLIDVREESERQQGYIKGSLHLSKGQIESHIEKIIPDVNAEIIVYCRGGFRGVLVADNLQKMGYQNVKNMSGGIRAWHAAGYPCGNILEEA